MKLHSCLLCFAFLGFVTIDIAAKAQAINVNDSLALVELYNSTNGPNWLNHENWLTGPVSTWHGITVGATRVIKVELGTNQLSGVIPASIGNLEFLQILSLYFNQLSGSIPSAVGNLTNLQELALTVNKLTGSIPSSLGNLSNLTKLFLDNNQLTGTIPSSVFDLTNLAVLSVDNNQLTGSIPSSIGNLVNLTQLTTSGNQLTGLIPFSIGNLTNLTYLDLSRNQFSGRLPTSIGNFINLTALYLYSNQFSDSIPFSIGNLTKLGYLHLYNNQFSGSIPASFGNLTKLAELYLYNNHLSGIIPPSIGNLGQITFLNLRLNNNLLTGEIPSMFRKIKYISYIDVSHNQLSESNNVSFPDYEQQPNLNINLSYNNFTFDGLEFIAKKLPKADYTFQALISVYQSGNSLVVDAGGTLKNNTYNWHKTGTDRSIAIKGSPVFHPTESGQYYAIIANAVATQTELHSDTIDYTATSIKVEPGISFYPNPAKNTLTINGLDAKEISRITIADTNGTIWLQAKSKQQATTTYDVSKLKPGNYVIQISNGKNVKTINMIKE